MFDLSGKTALVTGATGGIGGAIARALHAQGATVAISGTRREALDALAGELAERVHVLPCNLGNAEEVEKLVPDAEEAMGQLDILVNNAGITRDNIFMRLTDEAWDQVIAVNLTSSFRLARTAVRGMMRRRSGRINLHHLHRRRHRQCGTGQLCRGQGRPHRHEQVAGAGSGEPRRDRELRRPRLHRHAMTDALNEKQREAILKSVPAAKLGTPEDIAAACVFLASAEADMSQARRCM